MPSSPDRPGSAIAPPGRPANPASCVALPTFADGRTPSRVVFVDGSAPGGGDGSASRPFASLADAERVSPGTEIRVRGRVLARPGPGYGLAFTGTPDAPIWVTGEPGAVLVGRDGDADDVAALRLSRLRYLVIQDLEITAGPNHAMHFDASSYTARG